MGTLKEKAQILKENLITKLTTQEEKIEELKTALQNKTGGPATTNIYVQEEEPSVKDGLWLKTDVEVSEIIEDDNVFGSEEYDIDKMSEFGKAHYTGRINYYKGCRYIFSGTSVYRHSLSTNVWEKLDVELLYNVNVTAQNENIIYIVSRVDSKTTVLYYYDIDNNSCTMISTGVLEAWASEYYNMIYFDNALYTFAYYGGGGWDQYSKYNLLTNKVEFTQYFGGVNNSGSKLNWFIFDSNLYIIYSDNTSSNKIATLAQVDIASGKRTVIKSFDDIYVGGNNNDSIVVGNYLYVLGCSNTMNGTRNLVIKVNLTNLDNITYENLEQLPYDANSDAIFDGNYLIVNSSYTIIVLTLVSDTYPDKSIIIANNKANKYRTKLLLTDITNGLKYHFNDFWYATTEDDKTTFDTTTPKYYGNGTEWVQIGGTVNE